MRKRYRRGLSAPTVAAALILSAVAALVLFPPLAAAGTWSEPTYKGRVTGKDLDGVRIEERVKDVTGKHARRSLRSHVPSRVEEYVDEHGHSITVGTSIAGLNLQPFANVLAGTVHRSELSELRLMVVGLSQVQAECQAPPGVIGCYYADDAERLPSGQMTVGYDDPDLVHTLVHEYGHHVDNQLINIGHLDSGCGFDNDGSRNWFFEREVVDEVLGRGFSCDPEGGWEHLLGELYAEDYAQANGLTGWVLPVGPPTRDQKAILIDDLFRPFYPASSRKRIRVQRRRVTRHRVRLDDWTALDIRLGVPGRRNFDLYLYRRGGRRPLARSRRRGSRDERIAGRFYPPGSYTVLVRSRRGSGRAPMRIIED
jgi:hypothetical protein